MRDRLDSLRLKIGDLRYFHPWAFWITISVVLVGIIWLVFWLNNVPSGDDNTGQPVANSNAQVKMLRTDSKTLNKEFSQLNMQKMSVGSGNSASYVLTVSLYQKNPYLSSYKLQNYLTTYSNDLRAKYNVGAHKIRAIKYLLYDRKIVYDKHLQPRGTGYYMLTTDYMQKYLDSEDSSESAQESSLAQGNVNIQSSTETDTTRIYQYTIDPSQNKKIDYNNYNVSLENYTAITNNSVKPLTDEEFPFFLKLQLYSVVAGGQTAGIRAYLAWDLGVDPDADGMGTVISDFVNFMNRDNNLGTNMQYYTNKQELESKLAVARPQFLLYVLTGKVVNSRIKAQKELISYDSDMFKDVIAQDNHKRADSIQKNGKSTYQPDTEFDATVGRQKAKSRSVNSLNKAKSTLKKNTAE